MSAVRTAPSVPFRALTLSLAALAVALVAALFSPDELLDQQNLAGLLALIPALLLAHYRKWQAISTLLVAGMVILCAAQITSTLFGLSIQGMPVVLVVIAPYIAIALGAGWFAEVRSYAAEQQLADQALRRLEKALETMQLGVVITDLRGRFVYANPADARMHGFTVDELIGQDIGIYAPPGTRKQLKLDQLLKIPSRSSETTNVRRDGSVFPVHLRSDVVQDAGGKVVGVVTTCEDITERKQTEAKLLASLKQLRAVQLQVIQAEKLESIGRMAAGVAHEVKNPLMTILTGVKILTKRLESSEAPVRQLLGDMTQAVQRADAIIGGLLNFSRDQELDVRPADLNAIVHRALLLVKHQLDTGRTRVTRVLAPSLPKLNLDEIKIEQVLVNLFTNAIHAMGDGGEITVRSSVISLDPGGGVGFGQTDRYVPGEQVVLLKIDDNGPGISEQHVTKVFDPFFTTKPTGVGTGLGLSVCRQIIDMHGGSIEIANREVGGARVSIMFNLDNGKGRATNDEGADPAG